MTFMPAPDLVSAFISRTRKLTNTQLLTQGRVAGRLRILSENDPNGWPMPCYAFVWRLIPGPAGARRGTTPISRWLMQGECYGSDLRASDLLFRTWFAESFPDPPGTHGFIEKNCAVIEFELMGSPAPLQENETDYARVVFSIMVTWVEKAVPNPL